MAQLTSAQSALEVLNSVSPEAAQGFAAMRTAINKYGPIEPKMQELIALAGFTTAGLETGFRTHCGRALGHGATREEVFQAIMLTLGASATVSHVAAALRWADEVIAARS
jgi:alkylhydroperoxidase/carboxymuconolactone decarboxylase family protein YurZ